MVFAKRWILDVIEVILDVIAVIFDSKICTEKRILTLLTFSFVQITARILQSAKSLE